MNVLLIVHLLMCPIVNALSTLFFFRLCRVGVPSRLGEARLLLLSLSSTEPSARLCSLGAGLVGIPNSLLQVAASSEGDSDPEITASSITEASRLVGARFVPAGFAARFFRPGNGEGLSKYFLLCALDRLCLLCV